jgi:hypothetical protein
MALSEWAYQAKHIPGSMHFVVTENIGKEMSSMASLAFVLPLTPGKTEEWRDWVEVILSSRRSEYEAFSRRLGLRTQRWYLQPRPHGDIAIIYLVGEDLHRTFQHLRTSQDPFAVWVRQRAKDLFDGFDLTETSPESLSTLVFDGSNVEEDAAHYHARKVMEGLGLISP